MIYRNFGKRMLDLVLLLVLFLPASIMLFPVLLISVFVFRHQLFFVQERLGYHHKVFRIYKLATLLPETRSGCQQSLEERQTAWGRFLRNYSLDELPQLLNILKGEMSFVGPRPLLPEYLALYTAEEAKRHSVKPGLSGLAQVMGRNALGWKQKMHYDLEYVENLDLRQDLKVLFKTMEVVLKGQKTNYGETPPELIDLKWGKG